MAKNKLPVANQVEPPRATKSDQAREMRWRAEDALRDIERAKKHESDRQLMKHVKTLAKEKIRDLGKIK